MGNGTGAAQVVADESVHDVHGWQQYQHFSNYDGVHDGLASGQGVDASQWCFQM
jgi:hypothetical protein